MADALVVGAGPAGLIAAKIIAKRGFSITVYEEHESVGSPNHCAGLVSAEGLRRLGVDPSGGFVQQSVFGGKIFSPDGTCIEFRDKRTRAYTVDRAELDRRLAGEASDAGAEVLSGQRVERLLTTNGAVTGLCVGGSDCHAKVTINGEGASRRLLTAAGFPSSGSPLAGFNADVRAEVEQGIVELWLGEGWSKGLFAWVIPTGVGSACVGLATRSSDGIGALDAFVRKRFGSAERGDARTGLVLTGGPLKRTSFGGMLLVGDAAGHTKPTTGGGLVLGGLCAAEAGMAAADALGAGDCSEGGLRGYDAAWMRKYGGEFANMLRARRFMDSLGDEHLNRVFRAVKDEGLDSALAEYAATGDMDLQGEVIGRALGNPRIAATLLRVAGRLALSELGGLVNL